MSSWKRLMGTLPAGDENGRMVTRHTMLVIALLFTALAVILYALGRTPWCACGLGLWTSGAWSESTSQHFADPYSFSHVLHGLLFYWFLTIFAKKLTLRQRLVAAVAMEMGWEILENTSFIIDRYRDTTASRDYAGDSILNSVGDVLSAIAGFWIAARVHWKTSVVFFLFLELVMLATIRDNLTLNVLMLVYPVDVIKEWQVEASLAS